MNAFVRRLAVLSALWALCELLAPEGRMRDLTRLALSVLVMASLVAALSGLMGDVRELRWDAPAYATADGKAADYTETALRATANQARSLCVRVASRAGYDATATVFIDRSGALDHIALTLGERDGVTPLMSPREVTVRIAELFEVSEAAVWLGAA